MLIGQWYIIIEHYKVDFRFVWILLLYGFQSMTIYYGDWSLISKRYIFVKIMRSTTLFSCKNGLSFLFLADVTYDAPKL